jgi:glutaminyl-tRNA synthetase
VEHTHTPPNFIKKVVTRFPPEPNGYLHIGHAKAIWINFELAKEFGGSTNLRFDDTNPAKEDVEYVKSIEEDVKWLGYEWTGKYFASDYFDTMYEKAELLIQKGLAYVDDKFVKCAEHQLSRVRTALIVSAVSKKI